MTHFNQAQQKELMVMGRQTSEAVKQGYISILIKFFFTTEPGRLNIWQKLNTYIYRYFNKNFKLVVILEDFI